MNPEAIRLMAEKGLSAHDIADIAEAMQKKSSGAERQARYRARKKAASEGCDVTSDVTSDVTPTPFPTPPMNNISNPPTHTRKTKTRARKGTRLPEDWQPKPLTEAALKNVANWPDGAIERELARFRDWAASATGPNAVKKDWDAAWRQWLARAEDDGRYGKNGTSNRNSGSPTINANQRVKARLAASQSGNPASANGPDYRRIEQEPNAVRAIGHGGG